VKKGKRQTRLFLTKGGGKAGPLHPLRPRRRVEGHLSRGGGGGKSLNTLRSERKKRDASFL